MLYRNFEELPVWKSADDLNAQVGELVRVAKSKGDFRFADQIRGAALSITNNIAEGFERTSPKEFVYFLGIAKGSAGEVRSMLNQAMYEKMLDRMELERMRSLAISVSRQLAGFIEHLRKQT